MIPFLFIPVPSYPVVWPHTVLSSRTCRGVHRMLSPTSPSQVCPPCPVPLTSMVGFVLSVHSLLAPGSPERYHHSLPPPSNCNLCSPEAWDQLHRSLFLNTECRAGHSLSSVLAGRREGQESSLPHRTISITPHEFADPALPLTTIIRVESRPQALPTCSPTPDSGAAELRGSLSSHDPGMGCCKACLLPYEPLGTQR